MQRKKDKQKSILVKGTYAQTKFKGVDINMEKEFYIFKTRIANEMLSRGHKLIRFEEDRKRPNRTVFVFEWNKSIVKDYQEVRELTWQNN